jgi:hypothetical protein
MSKLENEKIQRYSELQAVIDTENLPTEEKIEIMKDALRERYGFEIGKDAILISSHPAGYGRTRLKVIIKTESTALLVALEYFLQLLGNVVIYNRVFIYKECPQGEK